MQTKYDTFIANRTWKLIERSINQYILIIKWVLKCKRDINNNIKRYKAR